MKTTTVRLDDAQVLLLEALAHSRGVRTSDVVRAAVRDYIDACAADDRDFRERRDAIARARMEDSAEHIRNTLGRQALPARRANSDRAGSGR
jgi:predicted transcriptional regulator